MTLIPVRSFRLGLMILFAALALVEGAFAASETPNEVFARARQIVTEDGIQEQGLVPIGGIQQWVSVRGRHRDNPILLFVHGGPGFTTLPVSYYFMRDWEEYFTVVQWDQRGAGKTYAANSPAEVGPTLAVDRMVDDAEEVVAHLRKTYGQQRIVLMAHSWGTVIGVKLAERRPEWLHAYVGMGQFVEFSRSEALGYQATLAAARAAQNQRAITELEAIAPFPDPIHPERNLQNLPLERTWLATFNGYYWRGGFGHNAAIAQFSPDYSAADWKARDEGMAASNAAMWGELGRIDLTKSTQFKCPIVIMQGRHDLGTSSQLVSEWYETIHAPAKSLIWFEDSAHMVYEEEPGKLFLSLVQTVLPLTVGEANRAEGPGSRFK